MNESIQVVLGAFAVVVATVLASWLVGLLRRLRRSERRVAQLQLMAMTDGLTGLPNRRMWEEQLPRELARALRYHEPLCVAMLDLDRFKEYNDVRGHLAGDRFLKHAASAWRAVLRPYDLLARYGGDEFGLILSGCALEDALAIVERLRAATPEKVSCSAGIAEWDRRDPAGILVAHADSALYDAKRAGRNRTAVAGYAQATH